MAAKKKAYLPIGSVVLLNGATKRVMIYGRKVKAKDEDVVYDYLGCLYPEGALGSDEVLMFNHENIKIVYFIGFQDLEEIIFRGEMSKADAEAESEAENSKSVEEKGEEATAKILYEDTQEDDDTEEEVDTDSADGEEDK